MLCSNHWGNDTTNWWLAMDRHWFFFSVFYMFAIVGFTSAIDCQFIMLNKHQDRQRGRSLWLPIQFTRIKTIVMEIPQRVCCSCVLSSYLSIPICKYFHYKYFIPFANEESDQHNWGKHCFVHLLHLCNSSFGFPFQWGILTTINTCWYRQLIPYMQGHNTSLQCVYILPRCNRCTKFLKG